MSSRELELKRMIILNAHRAEHYVIHFAAPIWTRLSGKLPWDVALYPSKSDEFDSMANSACWILAIVSSSHLSDIVFSAITSSVVITDRKLRLPWLRRLLGQGGVPALIQGLVSGFA